MEFVNRTERVEVGSGSILCQEFLLFFIIISIVVVIKDVHWLESASN